MVGRRAAAAGLAAVAGMALAIQARINGELGQRLDDGIAAAAISFAVGLLALVLLVPLLRPARRGAAAVLRALRGGQLRWWHCLGGVCGAAVVVAQGVTVAVLGVAVFTVALVAGQTSSGLVVDRTRLPPGEPVPLHAHRLLGAGLCVAAVAVAVADQFRSPQALVLALLPLLAGAGIAWQQAVNGRVRAAAGSALTATLVNFLTGMAALIVALGVSTVVRSGPISPLPSQPWLYVGGLLGVLVIGISAAVVRTTGVLLLGLATIAGQVVGALGLDLVVPADSRPGAATYAGAALTLAAVVVAAGVFRRR